LNSNTLQSKSRPEANGLASPNSRNMFASLTNRDYRFLWAGSLCSSFAMNMQIIARGWIVYAMTESPMKLAWVTMAFAIPQVVFSLFGGVVADRYPNKKVMVIAQGANAVATLVLATTIISGNVSFWDFIWFGCFNGSVLALSMPARQAMVPEIVGEGLLFNAMALNTASWNLSRILGPAIAGMLIGLLASGDTASTFGVGVVFFLISAMYLASSVTVFFIRNPDGTILEDHSDVLGDIKEGVVYAWKTPIVFGLIVVAILPFLFGMPMQQLLPAFNQDMLHGGPEELGIILATMGAGAIVGSLATARMGDVRHKGFWMLGTSCLWGVMIAICSQLSSYYLVLVIVPVIGLCQSMFMSMNRSLLQLQVEPEMRGRIMSIDMMTHGLMPLGIVPVSFIAEHGGIDVGLLSSAVALILATILCGRYLPEMTRIDRGYKRELPAMERVAPSSRSSQQSH
jgi:MFS family permease